MPLSVRVLDETTSGTRRAAGALQLESSTSTLREIIRRRVQQEVERFNQSDVDVFHGLVAPGETERILNGVRERRSLNWQEQFARALAAFSRNGFLVLVDDRQITALDEVIPLTEQTTVTFLRLVPLIGG
jgi:hypothetical protein